MFSRSDQYNVQKISNRRVHFFVNHYIHYIRVCSIECPTIQMYKMTKQIMCHDVQLLVMHEEKWQEHMSYSYEHTHRRTLILYGDAIYVCVLMSYDVRYVFM